MQFTPEHAEIRRTLRALIDKDINPHIDKWEEDGIFPAHEVFRKLGDAGLLGINKPTEFGGMGLDYSYALAMAEELGHIQCGSVPMAIGVQTDMATPALARHGSDELRAEFLAPSIAGDYVACLGVSEVGAGSDVASLKTTAKKVGGDWVIDGGKMWTTNGTQADWMCLLANTGEGPAHRNKSLIVVPMKTPGVQVVKKLDKLGMRSSDTAQIFFDSVKVPVRHTIGEPGKGFVYQMQQFQEERLWGAISAVVGLERLIDQTIEYTRERQVFGRPLLEIGIDRLDHAIPRVGAAELRGLQGEKAMGERRYREMVDPGRLDLVEVHASPERAAPHVLDESLVGRRIRLDGDEHGTFGRAVEKIAERTREGPGDHGARDDGNVEIA